MAMMVFIKIMDYGQILFSISSYFGDFGCF